MLEKIEDDNIWKGDVCHDPDHEPPGNYAYQPGTYKNTCPSCGKETIIIIPSVTC